MFFKRKKTQHSPSAERLTGITALKYYAIGGAASAVWVLFASGSIIDNFSIARGSVDSDYQARYVAEQAAQPTKQTRTKKQQPKTPEEAAAIKYPMPAALDDYVPIDKPDFNEVVARGRKLISSIKEWEKRTGLDFRKQPIFWEVGDSGKVDKLDPNQVTIRVENLNKSIKDAHFERHGKANTGVETACYFERTIAERDACLSKTPTAVVKITGKKHCFDGVKNVYCGEAFRAYMSGLLFNGSDYDLYFNDYEVRHHSAYIHAKEQYQTQITEIEKLRADYIAQITPAYEQGKVLAAISPIANAQAEPLTGGVPLVNAIPQNRQVEAWRFVFLFLGFSCIAAYVLAGNKLAIIRHPSWLPKHSFLGAIPFFALYAGSFWKFGGDNMQGQVVQFALLSLPPLLFMTVPTLSLVAKEWVKESGFYRDPAILTKGGEQSRMGGVKAYINRDFTTYYNEAWRGIHRTIESPFYLGKTLYYYDYKLFGRDIGLTSEQHLMLIAGSGGGKTRDIIANNLNTYNGGAVVFDMKGEHAEKTYKRRSQYAPAYLIDPFEVTNGEAPRHSWNPLAEIDPNSDFARSELKRLTAALIVKEAHERAADKYFREMPQIIMRGYMAHVLTALPPEDRHLPAVYDLLMSGYAEGTTPEMISENIDKYSEAIELVELEIEGLEKVDLTGVTPEQREKHEKAIKREKLKLEKLERDLNQIENEEAIDQLLGEMRQNEAIGGVAKEAAIAIERLHPKQKAQCMSDLIRALEWLKDPKIKACLSVATSFSLQECKTKDATVYFCIPKKVLDEMNRFIRLFYQVAFDTLDEYATEQPDGSNRRVLMVFDEMEALGYFEPLKNCFLRERSSFVKALAVVQNIDQISTTYNLKDFTASSDKIFFAIDRTEDTALKLLEDSLGQYTKKSLSGFEGTTNMEKESEAVASRGNLADFLNAAKSNLIVVPMDGMPLKLGRVPVYINQANPFMKVFYIVRNFFRG